MLLGCITWGRVLVGTSTGAVAAWLSSTTLGPGGPLGLSGPQVLSWFLSDGSWLCNSCFLRFPMMSLMLMLSCNPSSLRARLNKAVQVFRMKASGFPAP